MAKEFPGTPMKTKDFERSLKTQYTPDANYEWSAGQAIGRFLNGLRQGKILGLRCNRCNRVLVPPRAFCEDCFIPVDDWVELKDTGTINTYAISYLDTMANRIKKPVLPAVIEIDGAGGNGFMHILGEVDPKKVKIGMKVKAVWKPVKERTGDITDIKYFKPLKKGGD